MIQPLIGIGLFHLVFFAMGYTPIIPKFIITMIRVVISIVYTIIAMFDILNFNFQSVVIGSIMFITLIINWIIVKKYADQIVQAGATAIDAALTAGEIKDDLIEEVQGCL